MVSGFKRIDPGFIVRQTTGAALDDIFISVVREGEEAADVFIRRDA